MEKLFVEQDLKHEEHKYIKEKQVFPVAQNIFEVASTFYFSILTNIKY